jgi:hypothetical protein
MGQMRIEEDHKKCVTISRWNPQNQTNAQRYILSKGCKNYGISYFQSSMYGIDELHIMWNTKLNYMEAAIKILSFCDKNTTDDPELLSGNYTGNKETKKAKREEAANRKAIGLLRWEQHLRKVLGKSSSIQVNN